MSTDEKETMGVSTPGATPEPKKAPASCVKFTAAEYEKISEDARVVGKSIPTLLKVAYFTGRRVRVLMNKDDQKQWHRELQHWGNNLNQLARRVNAGLMEGWYEEFQKVNEALQRIKSLVVGAYGSRDV